jgi:hypothetical protein
MAFASGQAIRQRDPMALSGIIENFAQGLEARRRGRTQDAAQKLREEREARMAADQRADNQRLLDIERARGEREAAASTRQGALDLTNYGNTAEDNLRALLAGGAATSPADLEAYITRRAGAVRDLGGTDQQRQALQELLMAAVGQAQQPEPDVPLITLTPGTPAPKTVPKGAVVRNAPQPRVGPQPRAKVRKWVKDDRNPSMMKEVMTDPDTGARISDTGERRPMTKTEREAHGLPGAASDMTPEEAAIVARMSSGRGAGSGRGSAPASPAASPRKVGDPVTIRGVRKIITKVYPDGSFDAR